MRYRMLADGSADTSPVQNTSDVVALTVWFTLICGLILLGMGLYGKQRWLQFWGGLTLVCVAVYYMRDVLGLSAV
jgi:Ni,Fe-hydrogenase I cytochrome b subunit